MRFDGRLDKKAAIGLEVGKLKIKLRKRKQLAAESLSVCVFICNENLADPFEPYATQLSFLARFLWPAIAARWPAGDPLCTTVR